MLKKWIIRVVTAAALSVFLYSAFSLLLIRFRYAEAETLYKDAAASFTRSAASAPAPEADLPSVTDAPAEGEREAAYAPITVDFAALREVNPDVWGWLCCEGTVINYPVAHCGDNDFYLSHGYDRRPLGAGTIFSDAGNRGGTEDANIILYGHYMQDMSMFATLKYWFGQNYFDAHPVMWLLTPRRDYRLELYSVRSTSATSSAYTIFSEPCAAFDEYLRRAKEASSVFSAVEPDGQLHHVLLSTCAYSYYDERTVLHGQLVPVESAGGLPLDQEN